MNVFKYHQKAGNGDSHCNPAPGRLKQQDHESEASLSDKVKPCLKKKKAKQTSAHT